MRAYEMVLRGVPGLMSGSDHVALTESDRAIDQLLLQERYPGIPGLAWLRCLPADQLDAHLATHFPRGA
ncbi:hypothetical protein [Pseudomonas sp.]|uniref:hypothetical protein n=1 Tax=Pseudomonas sp. TaxID=306 RepID=UPI003BB6C0F6